MIYTDAKQSGNIVKWNQTYESLLYETLNHLCVEYIIMKQLDTLISYTSNEFTGIYHIFV